MKTGTVAFLAAALLAASCAGKPFDVKVVPKVEPEAIGPAVASGPVALRAEAVRDEDWLLENFDANLLLAGVLAVRVEIENRGVEKLETRRLRLEAAEAGGRLERLDPKRARGRIEDYYGLAVRSTTGDKLYKQDFDANGLDLRSDLEPGERRQGFLYFAFPPGGPVPAPVRLVVTSKSSDLRIETSL